MKRALPLLLRYVYTTLNLKLLICIIFSRAPQTHCPIICTISNASMIASNVYCQMCPRIGFLRSGKRLKRSDRPTFCLAFLLSYLMGFAFYIKPNNHKEKIRLSANSALSSPFPLFYSKDSNKTRSDLSRVTKRLVSMFVEVRS